jgi:putative transposon-encoded protein
MRTVKFHKGKLTLTDDIILFFEKRVTKFGNGAKVDCPKEFLGKRVYLMVCEE